MDRRDKNGKQYTHTYTVKNKNKSIISIKVSYALLVKSINAVENGLK